MGRPWPVTGSARCAIEGTTAQGVNWANVFWVATTGGTVPTPSQVNDLATAIYEPWDTYFLPLIGKDATLKRCIVNWYGAIPTQVTGLYESDEVGGSANNTEVDSLAAVVSWQFAATWRGGKPRMYLPALPSEAFVSSNRLNPTFITALTSAASNFILAIDGISVTPFGGTTLQLQSFYSGNAPRTPPVLFRITGARVHPRISSQRRRLGKEVP